MDLTRSTVTRKRRIWDWFKSWYFLWYQRSIPFGPRRVRFLVPCGQSLAGAWIQAARLESRAAFGTTDMRDELAAAPGVRLP
jgi:hypothetical protein